MASWSCMIDLTMESLNSTPRTLPATISGLTPTGSAVRDILGFEIM